MDFKQRCLAGWIPAVLALWLAGTAFAVPMPDLYTAEVGYDAQRRDGRQRAYSAALSTVLRRLTPAVAEAMRIQAFADPGSLVLGYRDGLNERMWVSLDGAAITAELLGAGLPVWGSDRPLTLVWMAIERENGERELVGASAVSDATTDSAALVSIRRSLAAAASDRGVPVRFPLLDDRDREAVKDSDIWGGFSEVIVDASRRYLADSVLIGRVRETAPQDVRWRWAFAGESSSFRGDIDGAVARVAKNLLAQFASSPGGSLDVTVQIVGIDGMDSFGTLSRFLNAQSLIERVDVAAMRADAVVFRIDSLTSRKRLASLIEGSMLEQIDAPLSAVPTGDLFSSADLHFRLRGASSKRLSR